MHRFSIHQIGPRTGRNNIILRFRVHSIASTTDLRKMYRQVLVHEDNRNYQKILWRSSENEVIQEYKSYTVTYGLAYAPFLAMRCVRHLASNARDHFTQASQVLLNDLYVDDILTGVNSEGEATKLIRQLEELLNQVGFKSHKWRSNCSEILRELKAGEQVTKSLAVESDVNDANRKPLGLNWRLDPDVFDFSFQ